MPKPLVRTPLDNLIPAEMIDARRWLNHRDKLPVITATGRAAFRSGTDRNESLTEFALAYRYNPYAPGSNLGFDIDAPFFAVDLDKVLVNDHPTSRGSELIARLPKTYTEYSPSGRGLHLWYAVREKDHAALPNATFARQFECYSRLRFFTVTANPYPGSSTRIARLTLKQAQAIFSIGEPKTRRDSGTAKRSGIATGLWTAEAVDSYLSAIGIEYRAYSPTEFRVRCPGQRPGSWLDGVNHDDDGLRANTTRVGVVNGHLFFTCYHAKCVGKRIADLYEEFPTDWTLDGWIAKRYAEVDSEFRRSRRG